MSRESSWQARISQLGRLVLLVGLAGLVPTLPLLIVAHSQGFVGLSWRCSTSPSVLERIHDCGSWRPGQLYGGAFTGSRCLCRSRPVHRFRSYGRGGWDVGANPWASVWEPGPRRGFALLTYMPLFSLAVTVAFVLYLMLRRALRSRSIVADDSVGLFALLGLAYSAFPQFFLFRPDIAHLSQFMPGFAVLASVCLGRWLRPIGEGMPSDSGWTMGGLRLGLPLRWIGSGLLVLHVGFYAWYALRQPPTGSIAMAEGRTERFQGANGVDVTVNRHEQKLFTEVARIVEESSETTKRFYVCPTAPASMC